MAGRRASGPVARRDPATGTWFFRFTSQQRRPDGGRRQILRRGFKTAAEANEKLREMLDEDAQLAGSPAGLTVDDLVRAWIDQKRLKGRAKGTIEHNEWAANLIHRRWGAWPIEDLRYTHLDECYAEMLQGGKLVYKKNQGTVVTDQPYSTRSVGAVHETIRGAYNLAIQRRQVLRNPADLATKPTIRSKRDWWDPDQTAAFLDYVAELDSSGSNPLPRALIEVLLDTGGRRGEALAITWDAVRFDRATVRISRQLYRGEMKDTKRPRSRSVISLSEGSVAALRLRRAEQAAERLAMGPDWPGPGHLHHDLVFTGIDGRALDPSTVTRQIARMSVDAGLPRLTPHGLRRSFATAALAAGVPVEVVAHRLGNTPRMIQEVYAAVIPTMDAAAAAQVADLLQSKRAAKG